MVSSVESNIELIRTKSRHTEEETAILHTFYILISLISFSLPSFKKERKTAPLYRH
jgi:hypothetical protein